MLYKCKVKGRKKSFRDKDDFCWYAITSWLMFQQKKNICTTTGIPKCKYIRHTWYVDDTIYDRLGYLIYILLLWENVRSSFLIFKRESWWTFMFYILHFTLWYFSKLKTVILLNESSDLIQSVEKVGTSYNIIIIVFSIKNIFKLRYLFLYCYQYYRLNIHKRGVHI